MFRSHLIISLTRKRECVGQLVYRMCEESCVDRLMTYNFAGLADEVEGSLSFKSRNADPRIRPFYSRILYTWYISRGDFRSGECHVSCRMNHVLKLYKGASTLYQRARKLGSSNCKPDEFLFVAEMQLEAYAASMNALSLLDPKSAWFTLPISGESKDQVSIETKSL